MFIGLTQWLQLLQGCFFLCFCGMVATGLRQSIHAWNPSSPWLQAPTAWTNSLLELRTDLEMLISVVAEGGRFVLDLSCFSKRAYPNIHCVMSHCCSKAFPKPWPGKNIVPQRLLLKTNRKRNPKSFLFFSSHQTRLDIGCYRQYCSQNINIICFYLLSLVFNSIEKEFAEVAKPIWYWSCVLFLGGKTTLKDLCLRIAKNGYIYIIITH